MRLSKLEHQLDQLLQLELGYEWDHLGLILGDKDQEVKSILLVLDINQTVVEYAVKNQIDLIITHHPILFQPINRLVSDRSQSNRVVSLLRHHIAVYAAHTNFDIASFGNNRYLANKLGLEDMQPLTPLDGEDKGIGVMGEWTNELSYEQTIQKVMDDLSLQWIKTIQNKVKQIKKIAIVSGAGMEYINTAVENNCDLFISGDLKYHPAMDMIGFPLAIFDAGHYGTEQHFPNAIKQYLQPHLSPDIRFDLLEIEEPWNVFTR